jgi:hypothetical protein
MLTNDLPALGVLFDIDLLKDVSYGEAAWKMFFDLIDIRKMAPGSLLASGDTIATLAGAERAYCIAIQNPSQSVLAHMRRTLDKSHRFQAVSPSCRFIEDESIYYEPLPEVAIITRTGKLIGFPASFESHWFVQFDGFLATPGTNNGQAVE